MTGQKNLVTKRVALIISSTSSFVTPFMGSAINIALPQIGRDFSVHVVYLSWLVTAYLLATAVFLVPLGRLADICGRRKIFLWGIAVFTLASLLAAVSWNPHVLLLARILQGFGNSMVFGTGVAILISVYPPYERGKALGINVASVYAGLSLGPTLGGLLTYHLGWRSIFLLTVLLGILVLVMVILKLQGEWVGAAGEEFDLKGSLLYGGTVLTLMYGFTRLTSPYGPLLVVIGLGGLFFFIWRELRVESPVLEMRLFRRNITFTFSNLAALINYSATFAVGFLLSLYLQYVKGLSEQEAGLVLVFQPLMQVIISPFAGKLSDRVEPRLVASVGMGFSSLGVALLVFLSGETPIWYVILCSIILGCGFGLFSSPNTNAVMSAVEKKFYGVASGVLSTMRLMGQMFSMGIVTLLLTVYMGEAQITPANHQSFLQSVNLSFIIFSVLCALGIAASLARGNQRLPSREEEGGTCVRKGEP
ncbi:multidrug resistance protein Stp [Thermacetogenium phaeum DSM 12270]|uniref:Multidrug resistance protein Stp n=1 Tax=Thermacetogenium phaeum (strain ATCC BAA-254 / DSM 26808 / PB) TaxID=1089553 RepID=K4LTT0_THEPS|nr:MFS transporter [Thermacetogenium phaeum]AFV11449.1 multidrug resistance protein Stp [Thermacetogenium phaeum DSM 12270]